MLPTKLEGLLEEGNFQQAVSDYVQAQKVLQKSTFLSGKLKCFISQSSYDRFFMYVKYESIM